MRKLASIVRIESCDPIPDTDRLSVTTMENKGWRVVTSRDEFKVGEYAIYFEIDSLLPSDDERYAFLVDRCLKKFVSKAGNLLDKGLRIKTIRLRGVYSQGLLMPLDKFPEILELVTLHENPSDDEFHLPTESGCYESIPLLDADVTTLLHIRHHDEVAEALAPVDNSAVGGDAYGLFPSSYIPKTDEERCVSGDTTVVTDFGRMKIRDVCRCMAEGVSFRVLSKNPESGMTEFKRIISSNVSNIDKEWMSVETEGGKTITCTSDHLVFVHNRGFVKVCDLTDCDEVETI